MRVVAAVIVALVVACSSSRKAEPGAQDVEGRSAGQSAAAHPGEPQIEDTLESAPVDELVRGQLRERVSLSDHLLGGQWSLQLVELSPLRRIDEDHWLGYGQFRGTLAGSHEPLPGEHRVELDVYVAREQGGWGVSSMEFHKLDGEPRKRPYVCPAHEELACDHDGACPVCGATLIETH
jgi:hypothetical protein